MPAKPKVEQLPQLYDHLYLRFGQEGRGQVGYLGDIGDNPYHALVDNDDLGHSGCHRTPWLGGNSRSRQRNDWSNRSDALFLDGHSQCRASMAYHR